MAHPNRPTWTADENELLRQHYADATEQELAVLLPRRNAHGIRMQAVRLRLTRTKPAPGAWSDEHMAILREHYPTKGSAYVADLVGRSRARVVGHAHEHLIPYTGVRNPKRTEPRKQYPEKRVVGRPRKEVVAAPLVSPPARKQRAAPKPVAAVAEPVKRSPNTPNLNVRAEQRRLAEKQREQKPKPYVTAAQVQALAANHPARWAWTVAARNGPQAATDAFYAAMNQSKQAV